VLLAAAAVISVGPGALLEPLAGWFLVRPPAGSIPPPRLHADPELQARLDGVLSTVGQGRIGAMVVELQTGAIAGVEVERAMPAASLFKLPLLIEVLSELDAGRLDDRQSLEIRPEDWTEGSGVLQARVGERLSVRELLRLMIQASDNIAALVLLDAVGVDNVNSRAAQLGLYATRLADHRAGDPGEHTTSAADMAQLFVSLVAGQAVNPRVSERALELLQLKQSVSWLADELPFWVKVAHKWGDLPRTRHDAGVVYTPRGSYVVAVLTEDTRPEESTPVVSRTSRLVYDHLGHR
jgi:beta-lactamase class A